MGGGTFFSGLCVEVGDCEDDDGVEHNAGVNVISVGDVVLIDDAAWGGLCCVSSMASLESCL